MTKVKHGSEAAKRHYEALLSLTYGVDLHEIADAMEVVPMLSDECKARGIDGRQFILAIMIANVGNFQCVSTDPIVKKMYLEACERMWNIFAKINPREGIMEGTKQ